MAGMLVADGGRGFTRGLAAGAVREGQTSHSTRAAQRITTEWTTNVKENSASKQ